VDADHTALNSAGKAQRDRLLQAILDAVGTYDPDDPDTQAGLRTRLGAAGRSHRSFIRPNGVPQHATMKEYVLVGQILMTLIHDVFGAAWRPEYDPAWEEAYEHASVMMLYAAWSEKIPAAVARRPRSVDDDTLRRL
jgi:hemoglobin-like flavoprotein